MSDAWSAPQTAPTPPRTRASWVRFVINRFLRLAIIPALFGAVLSIAAIVDDQPIWSGVVAGVVLSGIWLPTTALQLQHRYFAVSVSDNPILLTTGEWLDPHNFRRWMQVAAVERFLSGLMVLCAAGALFRSDDVQPLIAWAVLACGVALIGMAAYLYPQFVAISNLLLALATGDHSQVASLSTPIEAATWSPRPFRSALASVQAIALSREGQIEAALASLDMQPTRRDALHFARRRAVLRLALGERKDVDALRMTPPGSGIQHQMSHQSLVIHDALYRGDADTAIALSAQFRPTLVSLPPREASYFHLLEAAAHALKGNGKQARAARAKSVLKGGEVTRWAQARPYLRELL